MNFEVFPKPDTPNDLLLPQTSLLSRRQLFTLIIDPKPYSKKEAVVMSDTTCLFFNKGWVVNPRQTHITTDIDEIRSRVSSSIELLAQVNVWHPNKVWFIINDNGYYWPCNITPTLTPLTLYKKEHSFKAERQMISTLGFSIQKYRMILRNFVIHHVVLDLNPSNYGITVNRRVYYIDDDLYYFSSLRDFLGA